MVQYHLCHHNAARAKAPLFDPVMSGFVEKFVEINTLAYNSPGFIWHQAVDIDNPDEVAKYVKMYGEEGVLFNLSVWESVDALKAYTYQGDHAKSMKFRRQWFEEQSPNYVLWWKPADELPTLTEAKERMLHLATHGPSAYAFDFKTPFAAPTLPGTIILHPLAAAGEPLPAVAQRKQKQARSKRQKK